MLHKLSSQDLVVGLPSLKFQNDKVCDGCAKGKQVRSSFKAKNMVSINRPLELLHMDLCVTMTLVSIGGKRYVLVVVDDFSCFT